MIGTIKIKQKKKKCYFCVFIIFCFGRRNYNRLKYFISLHKTEAWDKKKIRLAIKNATLAGKHLSIRGANNSSFLVIKHNWKGIHRDDCHATNVTTQPRAFTRQWYTIIFPSPITVGLRVFDYRIVKLEMNHPFPGSKESRLAHKNAPTWEILIMFGLLLEVWKSTAQTISNK